MIYDICFMTYDIYMIYQMWYMKYGMIWYDMINNKGPNLKGNVRHSKPGEAANCGVYGGFCSKYPAFVSSCRWVGQYIPICSNRWSAKEMSTLDS